MLWSLSAISSKLFSTDRNSFQFSQLELLIIEIILISPIIHKWYLAVCSGNPAELNDEPLDAVTMWFDSSIMSPDRIEVKKYILSPSQVLKDILHRIPIFFLWIQLISTCDTHSVRDIRSYIKHNVHEAPYSWSIRDLTHAFNLFWCVGAHLFGEMNAIFERYKTPLGVLHAEPFQQLLNIYLLW